METRICPLRVRPALGLRAEMKARGPRQISGLFYQRRASLPSVLYVRTLRSRFAPDVCPPPL
jgi:hypothetical protein